MIGGRASRSMWSSAGRGSSTWRLKKALVSLMAVGGLSFFVSGTFALLSAQTRNVHSSVATGTLTLKNTVNSGSACFSYGGPASPGNVNNSCDALFTTSTQNYPGGTTTANVTIAVDGSLDASDLSLYMPSCTAGTTPGAPSPGSANPCAIAGTQLTVQETDSSWTPTTCRFPSAAGACTFVASSLYVFAANYTSTTSALDLGAGPTHGGTRYFQVALRLPADASNELQGKTAVFGLVWHATS
jgi:hypothetical protein